MYEQFFNFLGLREDPFHVSPDPRYFYTTPSHETALAELLYGIETRKGFLLLSGEAGTGKTSILKQILDWLKSRGRSTAYIFHTHLEPIGLLKFILSDFGVPCQSRSKSELVNALHTWLLQRHAAGDLPVLILDEAQALPLQTLDELRLLLNLENPRGKLLQIVLSGQPELEDKLRLPELRQLRQRIVFHSRLGLLTQRETAAYISRRLAVAGCPDSLLFPDEVVQDIYASSRGIPRVVNLLCEHALISAYAERQHVVSPEMVQRVAMDFDLVEKPLAVPESELQSQYARTTRFPLLEESESSNAVDRESTRWLEQLEFGVPKPPLAEMYKWAQPGANEIPASETAKASALSPKPMEHRTETAIGPLTRGIRSYWRRHRSRSAVTAFARQSAASLRKAWQEVTRQLDAWEAQLAAMYKRVQSAVKESPAAQVTSKAPVESPKPVEQRIEVSIVSTSSETRQHWRRQPSLSAVSTSAQKSVASALRGWHAATHPFFSYIRSVFQSFVKDCQSLFRGIALSETCEGLTPPTPALETGSSSESGTNRRGNRRVLAPVISWFRQPMSAGGRISANRSRSAATSGRRRNRK